MDEYLENKIKEKEFINNTKDIDNYLYKIDEKSKVYIDNNIDRLLITLIMITIIYHNQYVGINGFDMTEDKYIENIKEENEKKHKKIAKQSKKEKKEVEKFYNMRNFFNYMIREKGNKYNAEVILMINKSMNIFRKIYLEEVSNSLNENTNLDYDVISKIGKSINTNSFCKPSHFFEKVLYFKLIVNLESRYQKEVHQLFSNVKSNITHNKKIIKDFTSYSLVDLVFENLEELSNPKIVKVGPYLKIIWNGVINYLNKNMIIE